MIRQSVIAAGLAALTAVNGAGVTVAVSTSALPWIGAATAAYCACAFLLIQRTADICTQLAG